MINYDLYLICPNGHATFLLAGIAGSGSYLWNKEDVERGLYEAEEACPYCDRPLDRLLAIPFDPPGG